MAKLLPTEKSWKLSEMVKSDRVQGILGRVTSYSSSTGGRCSRLCTMIGRTLGRSRAELTKHENELGKQTFAPLQLPHCCHHRSCKLS